MKIDIFPHILPLKYKEALYKVVPPGFHLQDVIDATTSLFDLDYRFKLMDKYPGLQHILTLGAPPVEMVADAKTAADLARLGNDEMAELVQKYPDRFPAAVASLPMNDMDAALREADRAIKELDFRGVQIFTPTDGKPLDSPEFMPLYDKMAEYDLPIWIHPERDVNFVDYPGEKRSRYMIFHIFGWPYETAAAMTRLVFSGVFDKHPNIKFITHHCGGLVPYFEQRIIGAYDHAEVLRGAKYKQGLRKEPIEYFKMFYNDTAIYGHTPGLMCGYAFCGPERLVFGTDFPYDSELGDRYTRQTIESVEQMDIGDKEKKMIFEDNARRLLKLTE